LGSLYNKLTSSTTHTAYAAASAMGADRLQMPHIKEIKPYICKTQITAHTM
jgi:hypothetical protein